MLKIIQNRSIGFLFSAILTAAGLAATIFWGLRPGLDFTGGSLLEIEVAGTRPDSAAAVEVVRNATGLEEVTVQPIGEKGMVFRMATIDEPKHQQVVADLKTAFEKDAGAIDEKRFESVGPIIGQELQRKTIWAVIIAIIAVVLYITYAFRHVSYPISSWKYGVCTIVALLHDVIVPVGFLSVLGHFWHVEVGAWVVTALLTVLGFSVHDTIVVFDRIRENLSKNRRDNFEELVNKSVNETLARSINTSMTVLLVLGATYLFGGESIKYFILTMIIGIAAGTFSSIFVASPLLVTWQIHDQSRKGRR